MLTLQDSSLSSWATGVIASLLALGGCEATTRECEASDCACELDDDCVMSTCYYREGPPSACVLQYECDNGFPVPAVVRDRIEGDPSIQCELSACDGDNALCPDVTTWRAACRFGRCVGVDPVLETF